MNEQIITAICILEMLTQKGLLSEKEAKEAEKRVKKKVRQTLRQNESEVA